MQSEIFFILAMCLVAYLYSSVGHGGASGYLGLMALFGIEVALMKPSALVLKADKLVGIFTSTDACRRFAEFLRREAPSPDGESAA